MPSNKPGEFVRGGKYSVYIKKNLLDFCFYFIFFFYVYIIESKIYASKRRIKPEMISCPQGEVKHTGHVGLDGTYFGDISFFSPGSKVTFCI